MAERLLTPSKITAWLDCEHFLTLRHQVDSGDREPAPNTFGEMARISGIPSAIFHPDESEMIDGSLSATEAWRRYNWF